MGKNLKGGNKSKGMKNSLGLKRSFPTKEDPLEYYAKVVKKYGNRFGVITEENLSKERKARMRGTMRHGRGGSWINIDDMVLISLRDFSNDDDTCDILFKYNNEERRIILADNPDLKQLFSPNGKTMNGFDDFEDDNIEFTDVNVNKSSVNTSQIQNDIITTSDINQVGKEAELLSLGHSLSMDTIEEDENSDSEKIRSEYPTDEQIKNQTNKNPRSHVSHKGSEIDEMLKYL